eukprot:gene6312-12770_t
MASFVVTKVLLTKEFVHGVFSYLKFSDLFLCETCCKSWSNTLKSSYAHWLWCNTYRDLVDESCDMSCSNRFYEYKHILWRDKMTAIAPLTTQNKAFSIKDLSSKHRLICRAGHTANILNEDFLLLFGGASHLFIFLNNCDIFSLSENKTIAVKLELTGQAPSPRWLHTSCTIGRNSVMVFGGQSEHGFENDIHEFYVIDNQCDENKDNVENIINEDKLISIGSRRVKTKGVSPIQRAGHVMVAHNNSLIVFGGMTAPHVVLNDVFLLSLSRRNENDIGDDTDMEMATWSSPVCSGEPPAARWCHSGTIVRDSMIVFGGWIYSTRAHVPHVFLNDVWILNVNTFCWTRVDTTGFLPRPRCQTACMYFQDKRDDNRSSNTSVNVNANVSRLSPTPMGTCGGSEQSLRLQGYFVLYGGACHTSTNASQDTLPYGAIVEDLSDFNILDLDTNVWLPVNTSFPRCRGGVNALTTCPNGKGWVLSGVGMRGMHSDQSAQIPRFKNDLVYIKPNTLDGRYS